MKRFFLLIPSLFLLISASAQEFITAEDGSMSFGGLQWSFHGFAPGWKLFPVTRAFSPGKAEIRWDRPSSALDLSFRLRHPAPRPVELLFGNLKFRSGNVKKSCSTIRNFFFRNGIQNGIS